MSAPTFNATTLIPALAFIRRNLPSIPASVEEHTMLLAIAGQESNWTDRRQANSGPASSFWQFERGGILGVMRDDETSKSVAVLCGMAGIAFQSTVIWRLMGTPEGDNFSAAMARLLLWSDPMPLPKGEADSYLYYLGLWRPGAPSRERWAAVYPQAVEAIKMVSTGSE